MNLRAIRLALWAVVLAMTVVVAVLYFRPDRPVTSGVKIGGPFAVVDTTGVPVTEANLRGRPSVLFFGFTFCPEVCPTTLYEATQWLQELGPDGDRLTFYFITVDPERDTPEQMASYLSAFDPRIVGLTGSREEIDGMLKAYRVYSRKVPLDDGGYTMDHTSSLYLLDRAGELTGTISYGVDKETALAKLRKLIHG